MSQFTTELSAMTTAARTIDTIHQDIVAEHDRLQGQVDSLLSGGWTGVAAQQYSTAWQDWCTGMTEILAGLQAESVLIDQARERFAVSDADSQQGMNQISGRMTDRLG